MAVAPVNGHDVWRNWTTASAVERAEFLNRFELGFFPKGHVIDDPPAGETAAIAAFGETALRWIRSRLQHKFVMIEPAIPAPTSVGSIDLIEITEDASRYVVTMWECKASDAQASSANGKVYKQLDDYPRRIGHIADQLSYRCDSSKPALKAFLPHVGRLARNGDACIKYGAFFLWDPLAAQNAAPVPDLHKHPARCGANAHTLVTLELPNFKALRKALWSLLRFP